MPGPELVSFLYADISGLVRGRALGPSPLVNRDPSELSEGEKIDAGVSRLPLSLEDALAEAETDSEIRSWFDDDLWACYFSAKRTEIEIMKNLRPEERCQRYARVY